MVVSLIEQTSLETLENILELNMEYLQLACESEIRLHDSDCGYLSESAEYVHEGFIDSAVKIIHKIFEAIINFFKKITDAISSFFSKGGNGDGSSKETDSDISVNGTPVGSMSGASAKDTFMTTTLNIDRVLKSESIIKKLIEAIKKHIVDVASLVNKIDLSSIREDREKHMVTGVLQSVLYPTTRTYGLVRAFANTNFKIDGKGMKENDIIKAAEEYYCKSVASAVGINVNGYTYDNVKSAIKDKCNLIDSTNHKINLDTRTYNMLDSTERKLVSIKNAVIGMQNTANTEFKKADKQLSTLFKHEFSNERGVSNLLNVVKTIYNKDTSFITSITSDTVKMYTNAVKKCREVKKAIIKNKFTNESYYGYDDDFVYDFGF